MTQDIFGQDTSLPDTSAMEHWNAVQLGVLSHSASAPEHLGAVLEHIKAEQDKTPPKKRRAGKQRSRYKPNGRRNDGWNSKLARAAKEKRKASQGCDM